jgi:hypothetical protein
MYWDLDRRHLCQERFLMGGQWNMKTRERQGPEENKCSREKKNRISFNPLLCEKNHVIFCVVGTYQNAHREYTMHA